MEKHKIFLWQIGRPGLYNNIPHFTRKVTICFGLGFYLNFIFYRQCRHFWCFDSIRVIHNCSFCTNNKLLTKIFHKKAISEWWSFELKLSNVENLISVSLTQSLSQRAAEHVPFIDFHSTLLFPISIQMFSSTTKPEGEVQRRDQMVSLEPQLFGYEETHSKDYVKLTGGAMEHKWG